MAILINGNGNPAIYPDQDADWFASIFGGQTAITGVGSQFAAEIQDANTIALADGVIITKEGRRIQLDANQSDIFEIPTGAQGTTNYYIIGYCLTTNDDSSQTAETFVELMENATDTIEEDTFRDGADKVYVSLYRVTQTGFTLETPELLLPQVGSITQLNADLTDIAISSQIGSGTKNFSISNTKKRLLCVAKKSGKIVESKEIPISVLATNDIIPLGGQVPVFGNGKTLGLTDGTLNVGIYQQSNSSYNRVLSEEGLFNVDVGTNLTLIDAPMSKGLGVTTDGTKSGLIADLSETTQGATITCNSATSFTITVTDASLSVYVY